jgi:hypothetical protein
MGYMKKIICLLICVGYIQASDLSISFDQKYNAYRDYDYERGLTNGVTFNQVKRAFNAILTKQTLPIYQKLNKFFVDQTQYLYEEYYAQCHSPNSFIPDVSAACMGVDQEFSQYRSDYDSIQFQGLMYGQKIDRKYWEFANRAIKYIALELTQ